MTAILGLAIARDLAAAMGGTLHGGTAALLATHASASTARGDRPS
jgi:hypothetical protein